MGNNQNRNTNNNQQFLPTRGTVRSSHDYINQYILIAGGPSVVIFEGLIDQIYSMEKERGKRSCKAKERHDLYNEIHQRLMQYFPALYFPIDLHNGKSSDEKLNENCKILEDRWVELWKKPSFREEYFMNRFQVDPYLVLPTIFTNLERGIEFNVKRNCFLSHPGRQWYNTVDYSKTCDNFPFNSSQELKFELFANCFSADTWADVVGASFCLADYGNAQYLEEFHNLCLRLSKFDTYRMIFIFSHMDILCEKLRLGLISYEGDKNIKIRKELMHIPEECARIIEHLLKEAKTHIDTTSYHFPNRTYEFHVVNTSNDSDLKELLDCLCIGSNVKRRCFVSSNIELPPFAYPNPKFKSNIHTSSKLVQFCDIAIMAIHFNSKG